ncbi:MAG: hypothetical protein NZM18_11750 [Thermoflexales bacterium]|nr:hypothetical protein [Thermoflexales bacterium]MDW8352481.1 hypothetical protein [Anaerolineae bacterium]
MNLAIAARDGAKAIAQVKGDRVIRVKRARATARTYNTVTGIYMRKLRRSLIVIALVLAAAASAHSFARPILAQAPNVLAFTLDKQEAAPGETIIATYRLDRPARGVTLTAMAFGFVPLNLHLQQQMLSPSSRRSGVISFSLPAEAGKLSPLMIALNVDGQLRSRQRLIVTCDYPWFFAPRVEGCPFAPPRATWAAFQRFERGAMIWLAETDSVYVLYDALYSGDAPRLERYDDLFVEGNPDPPLPAEPPAGRFAPVRGFGLVWRTRERVRNALGWALAPEQGYTACLGYAYYGGKSMRAYVTTIERSLLEFEIYYAPVRWRALNRIGDQPVVVTGC